MALKAALGAQARQALRALDRGDVEPVAEALGFGLYEIGFADGTLAAQRFDERARRYLWSCVLGLAARGERFRTAQDAVERVQLLMRMAVMPAAKFPTLGSFLA